MELVGRLMGALASRGAGTAREAEAAELLARALGSDALLSAGDLSAYSACLRAVLARCRGLRASAAASLLRCFDAGGFSAALLLPRGEPAFGQVPLSPSLSMGSITAHRAFVDVLGALF